MKKLLVFVVAAILLASCGTTTPVTWSNITTSDAAYNSFKLASAEDQHDIIRSLLTEAEERMYSVTNQDELLTFKSKIETIRRYYRASKKQSISIENRIEDLYTKILKVEDGTKVINIR